MSNADLTVEMGINSRLRMHIHLHFKMVQFLLNLLCEKRRESVACRRLGTSVVVLAVIGIVDDDARRKGNVQRLGVCGRISSQRRLAAVRDKAPHARRAGIALELLVRHRTIGVGTQGLVQRRGGVA